MGHRSSKLSAGLTNGNTSINKSSSLKDTTTSTSTSTSTKLSKHSSRRYSSRYPKSSSTKSESNKNFRHSLASLSSSNSTNVATVCGDQQFLPILRLDSDSIAENANLSSVASNSAGQIIIKIHFKTHTPPTADSMDNAHQNVGVSPSQREARAQSLSNSENYRRLVDTNSNKVVSSQRNAEFVEAAGSSVNSVLNNTSNINNNAKNNNRASLPTHLNTLRITEPLLEAQDIASVAGAVDYYEVAEEPPQSRPVSSRRQKAKSAFMNFRSMLESSSSKAQQNKVTNSNNNNNHHNGGNSSNHSHNNRQSLQLSPVEQTLQKQLRPLCSNEAIKAALPMASTSSIYHDGPVVSNLSPMMASNIHTHTTTTPLTPISITTSSAALPLSPPTTTTTTATNNQLAIWASSPNQDLIISSINVVVCPPTTTTITTTAAATNIPIDRLMASGQGNSNSSACGKSVSNQLTTSESAQPQSAMAKNITHVLSTATSPIVHSQVDFVHYLVPDLQRIFNSSFYWGKMDRYEAERLLEGKPEGTFLLRDSAQEEYLFSVTFRKYGRSLHARIEQSGHKFSFDCHDPAVFSTSTVTGLLEHYKDPGSVMFFEPMLTVPFHRKRVFSLQQLARAAIVSNSTYDGITELELPVRLKAYLKEYHYKQKLRVKLLDETILTCT